MDAYTFMRVDCGKVEQIMEALVANKRVARAVAITGTYDIVARLEDVTWNALADFGVNELGRIDGVRETNTAVAVDPVAFDVVLPPLPLPIRKRELVRGALVLARMTAGAGADTLRALYSGEGIEAVAVLSGSDDLLIQVGGDSIEAVAKVVVGAIHPIRGIERTSTSLILRANPVRLPGGVTPRKGKKTAARGRPKRGRR